LERIVLHAQLEVLMNYPVRFDVAPPPEPRDRLMALLRPILAIPHLVLVGGPALGILGGGYRTGGLGALAILIALFDWIAILATGQPIAGLQAYKRLYLTWRARALAYAAFLRDEYPPFGEGAYPVTLELPELPATRDRVAILLRPLLALPHVVVVMILLLAWAIVAFVSWLWLVVAGTLPISLWRFGRDVMAYSLRVEAYLLLLCDQFPPFSLADDSATNPAGEAARAGGLGV
jgi:hypothetical protein